MSANDNLQLKLETAQLLAALDSAILKFQEFYKTVGASEQAFSKVQNAGVKIVKTLEDQAKLSKTGAYAFNEVSKAVDSLTLSLTKEALQNKEVATSLDAIRSKLIAVAKSAGDTKTAMKQALRTQDPGLLTVATAVQPPAPIDQSVVAKYQRNLFRLTGDDISALATKSQYAFRQIAKDAGEFAAKAGIPWETFAKKLKAVQAGDIKIFKPGAQADLQNVLLGLSSQYEKLAAAKQRVEATTRRAGLAEVEAKEIETGFKLFRLNEDRKYQYDELIKRKRIIAEQARESLSKEKAESEAYAINAKRNESILVSQEKIRVARENAIRQGQQESRQLASQQKAASELEARAINKTVNAQRDARAFQTQLQTGILRQKELTTQWSAANQKLVETYVTLNRAGQQQVTTISKQNGAIKDFSQTTYDATKASDGLLISWQSIIRMFSAQLLQQAMASFIGNLTQAVNAARDLQIQVGLVQTISSAGFDNSQWVEGIRQISDATGLLANDVAKGLYDTLSNQIADGGKSLEFLSNVSDFAVATNSTLKESVDAVSSAINSYGLTTESTTRITDVFFKMIDLGRIVTQDFANEIGRIYPGAAQLGVSLEEVSAALSSLTRAGVTPAASMTSLFNIFSRMLKPAGEMKEFFRSIGVESAQAAIQTYGFAQVLGKIAEFSQGRPELLAQLFPDIRGLRGVLRLAGTGLKEYQSDLEQMRNAAGTVEKAVNLVADTFGKRFQVELNKVQNYFTTVWGQGIVETVVKVSDAIGGLASIIRTAVDAMVVAAEILVITVLPRLQTFLTGIGAALAANPIGLATVGLTTAFVAAKTYFEREADEFQRASDRIDEVLERERERQKAAAARAVEPIVKAIDTQASGIGLILANTTKQYNEFADDIIKRNEEINNSFKESSVAFFNYLGDKVKNYRDQVKDAEDELKKIEKFRQTEPAKIDAKIRKIAIDETEENQAKYNLLEQELILERIAQVSANTREEQIAHYENILTIIEQMHKIEQDQEKKVSADEKERTKLLKERDKLEKDLAESKRKQAVAEEDQLKKARTKTGTRQYIDGVLVPTEKDALKLDAFARKQEEIQKRIIEINLKLRQAVETPLQGKPDSGEQAARDALAWQEALDAIREEELRRQQAINKEREVELENEIKMMRTYLSEFEKVKFDKLVDPDTSAEKFKKILASGKESLDKYAELARKYVGDDFNQRLKLETDIAKAKESLASTEEQATRRRQAKEIEDKIKAFKEASKAEIEDAQKRAEEARKLLPVLQTKLDQKLTGFDQNVEFVQKYANIAQTDETTRLVSIITTVRDLINKIRAGEATPDTTEQLNKNFRELSKIQYEAPKLLAGPILQIMKSILDAQTLTGDFIKVFESIAEVDKSIQKQANEMDKFTKELSATYKTDIALMVENNFKASQIAENTKSSADILKDLSKSLMEYFKGLPSERQTQVFLPQAPVTKAMGGLIHGSDSIPALLSKGEFVVNASATRRFYSQLVAMNGVQTFSRGGLVNNVGDINVSMQASGSVQSDIVAIGKGIQREIRRGRLSFS